MTSTPFLPSVHGHPNFNPVKIGKNLHLDPTKNSKQPKPPDKPLMPYMRYSKKVWDEVRVRYPDLKVWEISKIVGQMWRELPDNDKQEYIDAFESEKIEYNESLKQYHNSPAYQSWISSLKSKVNKDHEERDTHKRKDKKSSGQSFNSPQKSEGRVSLQPLDLDDDDEYFSMKHLAAARYYRNHKLVNEIFSDTVVPDVRTIVTNSRLQLLRKQVDSLTMHQQKLDEELKLLEDKFQEKKRALLDSSEKFNSELNKRFASKPVDEVTYQKMFDKALEQIKKDYAATAPKIETKPDNIPNSAPNNIVSSNNDSVKNTSENSPKLATSDCQIKTNEVSIKEVKETNNNSDHTITESKQVEEPMDTSIDADNNNGVENKVERENKEQISSNDDCEKQTLQNADAN